MKRTVKDLANLRGKVVLLRVDFNVPIDETGKILDATRIVNALPTIKFLSEKGAKVVVLSHLGRPQGYDIRKSLWPIALMLSRKLKCSVSFCNQVVGDEVKGRIKALREGNVLILENVRFFDGENECDMKYAKEISRLGDIFVNDAFGVAHRENASNFGIARLLPNAIGLLMEKEINALTKVIETPKKTFVVVLGGSKVQTKVNAINRFVEKADTIIIGGAMAYTFLKAQGEDVGASIVYEDSIDIAKEILEKAATYGTKILLPIDHVCVRQTDKKNKVLVKNNMIDDMVGYDIGPKSVKLFAKEIRKAKQVFWNGPMGKYEEKAFENGTKGIAMAMGKTRAYTIVGGGDTIASVNLYKVGKKINYLSTGGGASMKFIENNGSLPAIEVIQEQIL